MEAGAGEGALIPTDAGELAVGLVLACPCRCSIVTSGKIRVIILV